MDNTDKLKLILNNIIDKSDGITFYHIELNGNSAYYYKSGGKMLLEIENSGERIAVENIANVEYDDDIYFATFNVDGCGYGLNITKDMSSSQIFEELGR